MKAGKKRKKLDARFLHGIFVGLADRSDELLVSTPYGCFKARTVRRLIVADRKGPEFLKVIKGVPWCLEPSGSNEIKRAVNCCGTCCS